jgi:hypothetical protein
MASLAFRDHLPLIVNHLVVTKRMNDYVGDYF